MGSPSVSMGSFRWLSCRSATKWPTVNVWRQFHSDKDSVLRQGIARCTTVWYWSPLSQNDIILVSSVSMSSVSLVARRPAATSQGFPPAFSRGKGAAKPCCDPAATIPWQYPAAMGLRCGQRERKSWRLIKCNKTHPSKGLLHKACKLLTLPHCHSSDEADALNIRIFLCYNLTNNELVWVLVSWGNWRIKSRTSDFRTQWSRTATSCNARPTCITRR